MAALLTSVKDDKDKSAVYLNDCRRNGIKVLPPDVNSSEANFTTVGTDIRFGLTAVRNVGENVVASIVATRKAKGAFADFSDFLKKVEPVACNKKVVESLIKAGAFDSLGHTRRGLMTVFDQAVDSFLAAKRVEATGQFDLFGDSGSGTEDDPVDTVFAVTVPDGEWDKMARLAFEREMLGLYVSDHPLLGVEHVLAAHSECTVGALQGDQIGDGQTVTIGGILSSVLRRVNRTGVPWASAVLEDLEGSIEVLFFPQTYAQVAVSIAEDAIVVVKGRLDRREDVAKLIASDVAVPDLSSSQRDTRGPVVVSLPAARCTPPVVERLKEVLATHPGTTEVHLQLVSGERKTALRVADGFRVAATPALMGDLKALLGPACLTG
jgi:DNA polymerase-3 subunit alpha